MSHEYGQPPMSHADARAQARGAKAHAKALRPWYKKKRFILPLILVALILAAQLRGGGEDPTAGEPAAAPPPASTSQPADEPTEDAAEEEPAEEPEPATAGIGDTVTAGDWEFKVTKLKCGVDRVGDANFGADAQGQFCLLNLNATNNGDQAENLLGSNQKLLDKDGREFSPDDGASIYLEDAGALFEEINPGNTLKGVLVFDLPKKAKPVEAQLAGGLFGVKDVASVDLT